MTEFNPDTYAWALCAAEVFVSDFEASLAFYERLGFAVMYRRPGFAYLDYHGAQLMIAVRENYWETGELTVPFGRGVNFQIMTHDLNGLIATLARAGIALYEPRKEKWRDLGGHRRGFVEFLVQDPDGYLLRFSQRLG